MDSYQRGRARSADTRAALHSLYPGLCRGHRREEDRAVDRHGCEHRAVAAQIPAARGASRTRNVGERRHDAGGPQRRPRRGVLAAAEKRNRRDRSRAYRCFLPAQQRRLGRLSQSPHRPLPHRRHQPDLQYRKHQCGQDAARRRRHRHSAQRHHHRFADRHHGDTDAHQRPRPDAAQRQRAHAHAPHHRLALCPHRQRTPHRRAPRPRGADHRRESA